ncbi:MAG: SCO family protein [Longimicrobiales bacterium]|jgi:protein SCO1/2
MMRPHPLLAALSLFASTACGGSSNPIERAANQMSATQFIQPYDMPAVTLTDQDGEAFDLRLDTRDQITVLFFGYTSCPDICPITMASVARAVSLLEPEIRSHVGVLFVSLDANRDDPGRVKEWLSTFDPAFVGVTGTQEQLDQTLEGLGFVMPPYEIPAEGFYEVPHPASLFVFTPERLGRFGLGHETTPEQIAQDLTVLSQAWWQDGA